MLTKTDKTRLIKVCKVLFPKYKHVSIDRYSGSATLYKIKTPILRWFGPKWKISTTELIEFQIPKQMADFKYGNTTFINQVQEDLVRCEINKENKINYFLEEITASKYSDVYKQLKLNPVPTPRIINRTEEDEVFDTMILLYKGEEITKPAPIKSYWVSKEAIFYSFLLIMVLWSILTRIGF